MKLVREEQADILKGIGIVFMVAGHTGLLVSLKVDGYVGAFYMPMFFFVAGYFMQIERYTLGNYFYRKLKQLLIPYVIWSLFHLLLWFFAWKVGITLEGELNDVFKGIVWDNNKHFPIAGALWFITALFIASMTTFAAIRMFRIKMAGLFVSAIVLVGLYIAPFIPLSGDSAMVAIGFFYLGFLFRYKNVSMWLSNLKSMVSLVGLFIAIALYVIFADVNGSVNVRVCSYGNFPILFFLTALIGIFIWWQISRGLSNAKDKNLVLWKVAELFAYVGRYSMPYLCLNQLIIAFAENLLSRGGTAEQVLLTVIALTICTVINEVGLRIKPRWNIYGLLFGR